MIKQKGLVIGNLTCDGDCEECAKYESLFQGLKKTAKKYGLKVKKSNDLRGRTCPVGLSLSAEYMTIGNEIPDEEVKSYARNLGWASVGRNIKPKVIKSNIKNLNGLVSLSKNEFPVISSDILNLPSRISNKVVRKAYKGKISLF